jgi:hypothetical protein
LKVFDRPFFKKVVGSWGKALSRAPQSSKSFCLTEDQENSKTVQRTVLRKKPYQGGFLNGEESEPLEKVLHMQKGTAQRCPFSSIQLLNLNRFKTHTV